MPLGKKKIRLPGRMGLVAAAIVWCLATVSVSAQQEEQPMSDKPVHFMVKLLGTRDGWPDNMTPDEERIMGEHYVYLKELTRRGTVLMAGPVSGQYGLIVLEVRSEEEARAIMEKEPSVVQGVHTYEISPMVASLMASKAPVFRAVENPTETVLRKEVVIAAPLAEIWRCWTTSEGVKSFIAADANVQLRVGGPYEWYFSMEAPAGERGSEDCRVLSFLPMEMLSFEWNAPPQFGERRYIKTRVVVQFDEFEPGKVRVALSQLGWGEPEQWQEIYDYFDRAWGYVLGALKKHLEGE